MTIYVVQAWDEYESCRLPVAFMTDIEARLWIGTAKRHGREFDPDAEVGKYNRTEYHVVPVYVEPTP